MQNKKKKQIQQTQKEKTGFIQTTSEKTVMYPLMGQAETHQINNHTLIIK